MNVSPHPKKKLLLVSTKSVLGGAQRYIVDLVDYLPKDEFSISVAAGGYGPLAAKMAERAIPYYEIKGFDRDINVFKDIKSFFTLFSLIRKIRPDILHLNSSKAAGLGALAGRLAGVPKIISSTHGWPFLEDRPPFQKKLVTLATKIGIALQDSIICVSRFDYDIGIQMHIAPKHKLIPIHNGVDPKKHIFMDRNGAREKLFDRLHIKQNNYFIVGTIAEYTKNKGLFYLVEAAAHIVAVMPNALFFLMGWGEEKAFLQQNIEGRKLQNNVFLIDSLPEAFSYLKALDAFILPSIKEGFAYTLLEASLAELPIVTTRVGGNPEIIENLKNGFLIGPASPQEIINAISNIQRDPQEARRFGVEARAKVVRDFSIESMVSLTAHVYRS